jgi:hypothetical protein
MATAGLILALFAARALAQLGGLNEPIPLRSQPVSPAVIATWGSGYEGSAGPHRLQFLVLWRGVPGWLWPGPFSTHGEFLGGGADDRIPPRVIGQQISVGIVTFALKVDVQAGVAHIGDEAISLRESNVILVDQVDSLAELRVVRRMWVAPELPAPDRFEVVIQREPELRAFIRRDVHFQDLAQEEVARLLCARTLERR